MYARIVSPLDVSLSVTEKGGAFRGLSAVPERDAQQKAHVGGRRERSA